MIGDEICGAAQKERLSADEIKTVFGDEAVLGLPLRDVARMAMEKYEIFHIVTGYRLEESRKTWEDFLPGRVASIPGNQIRFLSEVITSLLQLQGGMQKESVINQWTGEAREVVRAAVADITVGDKPASGLFSRLFHQE